MINALFAFYISACVIAIAVLGKIIYRLWGERVDWRDYFKQKG